MKLLIARIADLNQYDRSNQKITYNDISENRWQNVYSNLNNKDDALFIGIRKLYIGTITALHEPNIFCSSIQELDCSNDQLLQSHNIFPETIPRVKANFIPFIHPRGDIDIDVLINDINNQDFVSFYIYRNRDFYNQAIVDHQLKENDRVVLLDANGRLECVRLHTPGGLINLDNQIMVIGRSFDELIYIHKNRIPHRNGIINTIINIQLSIENMNSFRFNTFNAYHNILFNARAYQHANVVQPVLENNIESVDFTDFPLNRILYGPPGTGKTYQTVSAACGIFESEEVVPRSQLKAKFDDLVKEGSIQFITFHQSYSYEDFVEGIRADSDANGQLQYKVTGGVFKKLCEKAHNDSQNPKVLIIDEINRGNISRIFGELITLIEPSKRKGAEESLEVTLPYSKEPFSVPKNLYIIATMNSADRSLAGLDIALRRRFVFEEMPPRPELLEKVTVCNIVMSEILTAMNNRIEVLLDRDHRIGHTYFFNLNNIPDDKQLEGLECIFRTSLLPLLQEYFFDDWEKIQWVLNDHRKNPQHRFIIEVPDNNNELFGSNVPVRNKRWTINEEAFNHIESYAGIINAQPVP